MKEFAQAMMEADWEYADPASGSAILVNKSGHISFATGASGETNTLPAPSRVMQILVLTCRSHGGGNRVITCSTAVNQTGNNTLTFGAAKDTIGLISVKTDTQPEAYRWMTLFNDGVALSTV